MRLMSASIAATAVITAVRAAIKPRVAAERPAIPSCFESLVDEGGGESPREPDSKHDRQTPDLIFQGYSLAHQLLARDDERADGVGRQRLHMHRLEEASAGQMRQTSRVVAIGLVGRQQLERLVGLPAFDADHRKAELAQPVKQNRRHPPRLEYDATTTRRLRQLVRDRVRHRRRLAFIDNSALTVENADVGLIHRDVEASEIVHTGSPLPNRRRSYWPPRKSSRPITRC
jgi:hypothetical protein